MRHLRDVRSQASFKRLSIFAAVAALVAQTLVMPASAAYAAPVINEVMANPVEVGEATTEWIELKNNDDTDVDISGWTIASATVPADQVIAANGLYVLCKSVEATTECDGVSTTGMTLANTGTVTLQLKDASDAIVDEFTYTSTSDGKSIEVVRENGTVTGVNNTTDPYTTNQTPSASGNTGTPGAVNHAQPAATAVTNMRTGMVYDTLQHAVNDAIAGDTITLNGDLSVSSQTTVSKALTIDGKGHTLSPTFTKTDNTNNATIGVIGTSNVTVKNLTINGVNGTTLHGVNLYEATNTTLNNLIIRDNDRYAVVVNSSSVGIASITTSGNGWGGVNVDMVTQPASATMTGVNSHDEFNALYVEGSGASMTDNTTSHQYYEYPAGSGVYHTKLTDLGPVVNATTHTAYDTVQAAINDAKTVNGNVIEINSDLTVSQQLTITKSVTINGNHHKVTGSFTKTSNSNNSVIGVQSDNVAISNLTVDAGSATQQLHGINVYEADGVVLSAVTALNGRSGVVVGQGSTVTITSITTSGNAWHGINVDKAGASLSIGGTNSHSAAVPPIFVDDITVITGVNDIDHQYSIFEDGVKRIYLLTSSLENEDGSVTLPAENGVATTPTDDLVFESDGAVVVIPANTVITASSSEWDGTILPPTVSSYVVPGSFVTSLAITVGSNDYTLTFDQSVVIALVGQAGKRVGFVPAGSDIFTEITQVCDEEFSLEFVNECKFEDGDDLYIVTNHFTTFVAYEAQQESGNNSGSDDQGVEPLDEISDDETLGVRTVSYNTPQTTYYVEANTGNGEVLGTSDTAGEADDSEPAPAVEASEEGWKFWGMAWYWWVLLIGALGAAGWAGAKWYRARSEV